MKQLIITFLVLNSFHSLGQDYLSISQNESFNSATIKLKRLGFDLTNTIGDDKFNIFWRSNNSSGITEIPILINYDKLEGDQVNSGNELDVYIKVHEGFNKELVYRNTLNAMKLKFGNPISLIENKKYIFKNDISLSSFEGDDYFLKVSLPNNKFSKIAHMFSGKIADDLINERLVLENSNWKKAFNYYKEKNYPEAIKYFTLSINIIDNLMYSYIFRGWSKAMMEDSYGSMEDLNKAYELMKNVEKLENADLYFYKGLVHLTRGEKSLGCQNLSRAGELGKKEAYEVIKGECN